MVHNKSKIACWNVATMKPACGFGNGVHSEGIHCQLNSAVLYNKLSVQFLLPALI